MRSNRAHEADDAALIISKVLAWYNAMREKDGVFTKTNLPNQFFYIEDVHVFPDPNPEKLLTLIEHANTGGTFGFGNNRTYKAFQAAGYLDSKGNPTRISTVFLDAWNAGDNSKMASPQDDAASIISKVLDHHFNMHKKEGILTRTNLSTFFTVNESSYVYPDPSPKKLEALIEHANTGGTFGFGNNRTYKAFQAAGYLDKEGNPTTISKVFFNTWNAVMKAETTTHRTAMPSGY